MLPAPPRCAMGRLQFRVSAGLLVGRPLLWAGCASSTGLHRVVGKWQPLLWPQILLNFLFLLACLFIPPLSLCDWYQSSPVHVFLFSLFGSKKCQALATRDSLVLPCGCMWIRAFVIDVFQHFFDIIFYCSLVNNANRHYMSEIIHQFKWHKFMAPKQRGMVLWQFHQGW